MLIDVIVDAETLGTGPMPILLSFAAIAVDRATGKELSSIDIFIDVESQDKSSLTSDTVNFWLKLPKEAQQTQIDKGRMSIQKALVAFDSWLTHIGKKDILLWGNGTMADNRWLDSAYNTYGKANYFPLEFWQHRCIKTVVDVAHELGYPKFKFETKFNGIPHNAIDDCRHQYCYLTKYLQAMVCK